MDSSPPSLPPVPPAIGEITSPLIFGLLFGWALYGALCVQVYIYHICFSDKKGLRTLVYVVFLLDTTQTILAAFDAHYWFGSGFGNIIRLSNPYLSAFDSPLLDGVISLIVQWFFCYRIWVLSNKTWYLPLFIGVISLMQAICAITSGIQGHLVGNFAISHSHFDLEILYIWFIGSVVADILIAGSMIYLLLKSKSQMPRTNLLLSRLVRLVLETNLLTAVVAFLALVLYATLPDKSYFNCLVLFLGKLYSNTFMVTLNNRVFIGRSAQSLASTGSSQTRVPRIAIAAGTEVMQLETFNTYPDEDTNSQTPSERKSRHVV